MKHFSSVRHPERPPLETVLTKPYDWVVWIFSVCGTSILAIVTLHTLVRWSEEVEQHPKIIKLGCLIRRVALIYRLLPQCWNKKWTGSFPGGFLFGSRMSLSVGLRFVWIFMIIIVTNACTALLYSLFTNGDMDWACAECTIWEVVNVLGNNGHQVQSTTLRLQPINLIMSENSENTIAMKYPKRLNEPLNLLPESESWGFFKSYDQLSTWSVKCIYFKRIRLS